MNVVAKIGSSVLTDSDGNLNNRVIANLAQDVALLYREGFGIVLVSSGAISAGKTFKKPEEIKISVQTVSYSQAILKEQILAAVGQPRMYRAWEDEFNKLGIACGQILTTRAAFADRLDYLSTRALTLGLLENGAIPIINEDDARSPDKLDFTDNDQLAAMVAAMLADKLIILTDVAGVFSGSPHDPASKLVSFIENPAEHLSLVDKNAGTGKGGMNSKLFTADLATALGVDMHIASGFEPGVLSKIMRGENVGTFFPAKTAKVSHIKSWIGSAAVAAKGKIIVSNVLADRLRQRKPVSVLFSGIESVEGAFFGKDIVEVYDVDGSLLARGQVKKDSEQLREEVKKYREAPDKEQARQKTSDIIAIHYDYLVACC